MKAKRLKSISITLGICAALFLVAYAFTSTFFGQQSIKTEFTKGHVFKIILDCQSYPVELIPGSRFTIKPTITNNGTDEIYCFIDVDIAALNNSPTLSVISFDINNNWKFVTSYPDDYATGRNHYVFAYTLGENCCVPLYPGEVTTELTQTMTLKVDNLTFSTLNNEDINVTITGMGISTSACSEADTYSVWNIYQSKLYELF